MRWPPMFACPTRNSRPGQPRYPPGQSRSCAQGKIRVPPRPTNPRAKLGFAPFLGWHEGPAKLTVLVPALLGFCLAPRPQTQGLLYVVSHQPHRLPQAGPPVLAATKYNSALCPKPVVPVTVTARLLPAPQGQSGSYRASPSCILHASPLTPHLDLSLARAGKRGVSVFED